MTTTLLWTASKGTGVKKMNINGLSIYPLQSGYTQEQYDAVVNQLSEKDGELTTTKSELTNTKSELATTKSELATSEESMAFVKWLFSPVIPTGSILNYSKSGYWTTGNDRVNLKVWDIWVYFFVGRISWDTADADFAYDYADWALYFVDCANKYALKSSLLGTKSIPKGKRSWYTTGEWFWWGTRYLWQKGDQLKYHAYRYSCGNSEHSFIYYSYGLYTLDIDCKNKTFSANAYYDRIQTGYTYDWDVYHPVYYDQPTLKYENLSYYPDSSWTLLGNPNGDNMNPTFSWYKAMPVINQTGNSQNSKSGTVSLQFTSA